MVFDYAEHDLTGLMDATRHMLHPGRIRYAAQGGVWGVTVSGTAAGLHPIARQGSLTDSKRAAQDGACRRWMQK